MGARMDKFFNNLDNALGGSVPRSTPSPITGHEEL